MGGRWRGEITAARKEQNHRRFNVLGLGREAELHQGDPGLLPHNDGGRALLWQATFFMKCHSSWHGSE